MPSQFLTAGLRLTRRVLGVLRGMAMLLTGSVLLRGITLTFALVHFAISGSDSLVELCALSARPAARAPDLMTVARHTQMLRTSSAGRSCSGANSRCSLASSPWLPSSSSSPYSSDVSARGSAC